MSSRHAAFMTVIRLSAALVLLASGVQGAEVNLNGRIVDENDVRVAGARITIRPSVPSPNGPAGPWETTTDPTGAFSVRLPEAGDYLIGVTREGYYELKDRPIHAEGAEELTLVINAVREVFQSSDVNERPSPVDVSQTVNQERLSGTEVNDTPYTNSHDLRQSIQLIPGVVADPTGALHFNGSSENQVLYLLNGFNITDPISGEFHTALAVESVRSLDFSSGRYSPEYGQGSAGVLAVNTATGTDAFHYTATDFIPGLSVQHGARFGNWYPRAGVSGPIVRGKAWFSDTFYSAYNQSYVPGLPSGQNTRSSWAGSNLLHAQVNLTPSNILFADFLVNVDDENRAGLGPLDPVSTTSNTRGREYFASLKDQIYLGHGALIELGYAYNYFLDTATPQGDSLYVFSPEGRSGNYFLDSRQTASRNQALVNGYLPSFHFAGTHQIKAGVGADLLGYSAANHRTGYELLGLGDSLLSETLFQGPGNPRVSDTEMSAFLLDTWRVSKSFQLDLGARGDWDRRIQALAWSPRAAFSWSPTTSGRTRVSAGYAITHDQPPLELLGRPFDQTAVTTTYNPDGTPAGPPALTSFILGHAPLDLPRATNWTVGVDHQLSDRAYVTAKYLRRRENDGFVFINTLAPDEPPYELPLPNGAAAGDYALANLRRDGYDCGPTLGPPELLGSIRMDAFLYALTLCFERRFGLQLNRSLRSGFRHGRDALGHAQSRAGVGRIFRCPGRTGRWPPWPTPAQDFLSLSSNQPGWWWAASTRTAIRSIST